LVSQISGQYPSFQTGETKEKKEDQEIIYTVVKWDMVRYRVRGEAKFKSNTMKQWRRKQDCAEGEEESGQFSYITNIYIFNCKYYTYYHLGLQSKWTGWWRWWWW
jgi:hypothetical protein